MKAHIKLTQIRSAIGQTHTVRLSLKGLGLRGPHSSVTVANTPSFRGAIKKVMHLIKFEETDHG